MSESLNLNASLRDQLGSRASRKLRAEGRLPATLPDAQGGPARHIHLDEREFLASRRHHVHLYDVSVDGEVSAALVRELQWDAFGRRILHVDFKPVQRGVETEADVPVELVGQPKSGQINLLVPEITLRMLPKDIPDVIEVRVGALETGAHVRAKDLVLPEGVSLAVPENLEIAVVSHEQVVEEQPATELESEPEVIGEKKREEEAEGDES